MNATTAINARPEQPACAARGSIRTEQERNFLMSLKHKGRLLAAGALLAFGAGWAPTSFAADADLEDDADFGTGTAAGEVVTNAATLDFEVSGVNQDDVLSDPVDFRVDRRLRVSVTAIQDEEWTPGIQNAYLRFNVANLSNSEIDIFLGAVEGGSPDFTAAFPTDVDASAPNVRFCDDTIADCENSPDFVDKLTDVPAGDTREVYMYFDIPSTVSDGEEAPWHLVAAIANPSNFPTVPTDSNNDSTNFAGTAGQLIVEDSNGNAQPGQNNSTPAPDAALTIQDVFADGTGSAQAEFNVDHSGAISNTALSDTAQNGQHSAVASLVISTPTMEIVKTSRVVYDPINGGCALDGALFENWEAQNDCTGQPKRIPGAIVEYKVVVTNSSTSTTPATDVTVADSAPSSTSAIANAGDTFFGTEFPNPFVQTCSATSAPAADTNLSVDGGFTAELDSCGQNDSGIVIFYVEIQ